MRRDGRAATRISGLGRDFGDAVALAGLDLAPGLRGVTRGRLPGAA